MLLTHTRPIAVLTLLAIAGALTGCMSSVNDRSYVGVDPQAVAPLEPLPYNAGHGLSREHWQATAIHVPVDGTAHRPTYNSNIRHTRVTPRQRGEMPTAESALDLREASLQAQVQEVPIQLGSAALDAVSIPGGLIAYHQANTRFSPDVTYQRTLRAGATAQASNPTDASMAPAQPNEPVQAPPARSPVATPVIGQMTPVAPSAPPSEPASEPKQ